jgi:hypothetical protein
LVFELHLMMIILFVLILVNLFFVLIVHLVHLLLILLHYFLLQRLLFIVYLPFFIRVCNILLLVVLLLVFLFVGFGLVVLELLVDKVVAVSAVKGHWKLLLTLNLAHGFSMHTIFAVLVRVHLLIMVLYTLLSSRHY